MADVFDPAKRSWIMSRVHAKNTAPEILVRKLVHGMGFRYRLHVKTLPGKPDIVLTRHKKIILVHGCFWHGHNCPRAGLPESNTDFWGTKIAANRVRDERDLQALQSAGWHVLVIWQCETHNKSLLYDRLRWFFDEHYHDESTSLKTD